METSPLHVATDCKGLDPKDGRSQVLLPFKPREKLASDELKQRLHARLQEALFHLFPVGKIIRNTFVVGNVQGHEGKSLTIELSGSKAGLWHDFATGEGGDIFSLWGTAHGWDHRTQFPQITNSVQEWLGISSLPLPQKSTNKKGEALGAPTAKWHYHDAKGKIIACVYRYDTPDGKQFRPWDVKAQKYKAPEPRPLYNQSGLARSETVILVEGEKCADALINLGICATTAMNGANAIIDKTDWSPLLDKHVVIWPDHDAPGKAYAGKVIKRLQTLGLLSLALLIISDKPRKWDAADAVAEGMDMRAFIEGCPREVISLIKPKDTVKLIELNERKPKLTSGLLTIGSDFEIGRRALLDLRQKYGQIIFTEGEFYR